MALRLVGWMFVAYGLWALLTGSASGQESRKMAVDSGYVEVAGGRLYYERTGTGEPLVLLHDGLMHHELWDYQFVDWAERYDMVRFDRRGFGKSPAPTEPYSQIDDMLAVFKALGIDKAGVAGMSAGGRLALDFALEHPERVSFLILVSPAVSGLGFTEHFLNRGGHIKPGAYTDPAIAIPYWCEEDPYEIWQGNTEVKAKARAMLERYTNNIAQMRSTMVQPVRRQALGILSEVKVPTLVVGGEYDAPDMHAHQGAIVAGIAGAERVVLKNCAHRVVMEQPVLLDQAVTIFLSESRFFGTLRDKGAEAAAALLESERRKNPEAILFREAGMNQRGYQALLGGDIETAKTLFRLNVQVYPQSSNVYDSYGEALLAAGDTTAAITNYQKSLELDSTNTNAAAVLARITSRK